MRKYFNLIFLMLAFIMLTNITVFAQNTTDSYIAVYENGRIEVRCNVDSAYAGKPATVALRLKSDPVGFPLYFNDTVIERDGKINISFPYEIENVNAYSVRLNVADEYTNDIAIQGEQISYEDNLISDFAYLSNGEWKSLDSTAYDNMRGREITIGVTVPDKFENSSVAIFAIKDNDGRLQSVKFGEAYDGRYKALLDIPASGIIEIYCWDSLDTLKPCCDKACLPDDCMQTLTLTENFEPISENPGKGWVRYRSNSTETEDVLQYVSIGYDRFNWNQLEPSEGEYNSSAIDTFINKWDNLEKKAAFGIACASSTNSASYLTPKWVFDAGAKYTLANNETQYVPVWNDAVFLEKLDKFTAALAKRYDGDPRIAFIDIRSYGNFGETHTSGLSGSAGLSANEEKLHIDIAAKYFKKTQLIIPTANTGDQGIKTKYAVNKGVGLRIDSILNGNYSETHKLDDAYGKEPTVFEFVNSYTTMKNATDSYGSQSNDDAHWDRDRYLLSFFVGKPSYMDLGQYNSDSQSFINDNRELIELLSNKMGYHFVLKSVNIPECLSAGKTFNIDAKWINKGVAPLYEECYPALALLDSNNKVIDRCWLDSFNPQEWLPDTETQESAAVEFASAYGNTLKLALGLFSSKTDLTPSYKIGNYNRTSDNWYIIANAEKSENKYLLNPVSQPAQATANTTLDDFYNSRFAPFYGVPVTANIITDSTFETAVSNWSPVRNLSKVVNQQAISPYAGIRVGRIYERSAEWSGAQTDITELLKKNGAGTYRFEGWFRNDSSSSRNMTIYPFRINSVTEYKITATGIGSAWKKVTGDIVITQEQINKLTHAVTLIIGDSRNSYNRNEIYMDNVTLTKIN